MDSIGARLKQARQDKGVSLEQAQKDTRIHNRILAALEDDRPEESISGTVYIKSFIKKYADYLGLDGATLAEGYKTTARPRLNEQVAVLRGGSPSFKFPLKGLLTAVVVIVVIFFGIKLVIFTGTKIKSAWRSGPKLAAKAEAPKPKQAASQKAKPAVTSVATQIPKSEKLILKIKAKSDVYLKVKADGNVIFDGILKKGSTETWEAADSLDISTSRAEAITAELNGTSLGALGKGVTKNILITRDGVKLPK